MIFGHVLGHELLRTITGRAQSGDCGASESGGCGLCVGERPPLCGLEGRRTSGQTPRRVSLQESRFAVLELPQAAHRAGHALRLMVDPSAVAAVHLGACLLQRPGGHGVCVGQPALGATFAGLLQLGDERSCSLLIEVGRHPGYDHIPHWVGAQQVRRERGGGLEAADIGCLPAVDITLSQRCCGHALDRATAGTYPQPLSASCPWPWKVLADGQVEVPPGGQVEVLTLAGRVDPELGLWAVTVAMPSRG